MTTPRFPKPPLDDRRPNLRNFIRDDMLSDPPPPPPEPQPPLRCLADLPDQPQEWLWPGRIPCGALTLLCGDEGRGKSLVALDMAARVSAGLAWPQGGPAVQPADVLIFSAEDSLGRTVRGRLLAAGADLNRIHYVDTAHWSIETFQPTLDRSIAIYSEFGLFPASVCRSLQRDVRHLRGALEALPDCRLVVLDPFPAYLDNVDLYYDEPEDVRTMLAPLTALADLSNAAVLAVVHRDREQRLQSGRKRNGLRTLASMSRAAYLVDRSADDCYRHVLLPVKNNLGDATTAVPFNVVAAPGGDALIEWSTDPVQLTGDEVLSPSSRGESIRRTPDIERATAWLEGVLAAGPIPSQDLAARAFRAGINERCLRRARVRLGVNATNDGKIGGPWQCTLPNQDQSNGRDDHVSDVAITAISAASPKLDDFQQPCSPTLSDAIRH